MSSMWNLELDKIVLPVSPADIIESQCDYLREYTNGKIIAKIANYEGVILSPNLFQHATPQQNSGDNRVDIQEELGRYGGSKFTFELFITSTGTPNYKFRIMFLAYGIEYYPVIMVVDEEIASEIEREQHILCDNEYEFEDMLKKILASKKVSKVINHLYSATLREERRYIPY